MDTAGSRESVTTFQLNPNAREFNPATEEDRSLFLTFSNGLPISESAISTFFKQKYGNCVETVYVRWANEEPARYGRVVFNSSVVPQLVLRGMREMRFVVDGRPMSCKKYIPRTIRKQEPND